MGDKLVCRNLTYDARIGFHPEEKAGLQTLIVDFEVDVPPMPIGSKDDPAFLPLDYHKAHLILADLFRQKSFNLVEAAAEAVAEALLERFTVGFVVVNVTKHPIGLTAGAVVTYRCERKREPLKTLRMRR